MSSAEQLIAVFVSYFVLRFAGGVHVAAVHGGGCAF